MGSIIGSGIGSGLDIQGLVSQLVKAEGAPKTQRLNVQEARAQAKLSALATLRSALGSFRSALGSLKDLAAFQGRTVKASSSDFISATTTSAATPGSYSLEVERLAAAHRLHTGAHGAADAIGTGTLSLSVGDATFTVEITEGDDTLAGIAAMINRAADNVGITASLVNGVDGSRLVLAATQTGAANRIVVAQSGGNGGLAALEYDPDNLVTNMIELEAPQDARILINTFAVESASNTIADAVPGVSITLLAKNESGETTDLTVAFDKAGARKKIDNLVKSYNGLLDSLASVSSYDASSQTAGPLFGDSGLRNIKAQIRRELGADIGVDGPFRMLSDIGIETELDGKLSINAARLDAAFADDFDAIGRLFSDGETGIAGRLDAMLDPYLASNGILDTRTKGFKATIGDIGEQREALEVRLQAVEARLLKQFNALDSLLAQLQTTSSYLDQQLKNLPGTLLDRKK
jgi:flagellar hook-associated protein 2